MDRLPFDPEKMTRSRPDIERTRSSNEDAITVTQLAGSINDALRDGLPSKLRVIGEIGQFRERTHWYFDLKDEGAVVNCVMFASAIRSRHASGGRMQPKTGDRVIVTGRVDFFGRQGRTQLYVDRVESVGEGPLDRQFRELCNELKGLGYFDERHKRPLPAFPRRLAVVTSRSGAAYQDVLDTLRRRCPWVRVSLVDVRVQGDGSASEIAWAIGRVDAAAKSLGVDGIILTRGGGSKEDLWSFNERVVADAIYNATVPIAAAVGHETDVTIAELVADEWCATPTQAAMRMSPDVSALREQLETAQRRLLSGAQRDLSRRQHHLRLVARHPFLAKPASLTDRAGERLAHASGRLSRSLLSRVRHDERRLGTLATRLDACSPQRLHGARVARVERLQDALRRAMVQALRTSDVDAMQDRLLTSMRDAIRNATERCSRDERSLELVGPKRVLSRGYSITVKRDGGREEVVRSATQVEPGQRVETILAEGVVESVVEKTGTDSKPAPAKRPKRVRSDTGSGGSEPGLFDGG